MLSLSRFLLGAALLASSLHVQGQSVVAERHNVVQLSATGNMEVPQDWLTMQLSVTREGTEPAALQTQLKAALDAALGEARKLAQPGQMEVRTGQFGLHPRHGRDGKLTGWQGSAELILEGRDMVRIAALAGRIQSMTLAHLSFGLSREQRQKVESEVQGMAIAQFKAKAAEISKSFGFAGYTLREVAVNAEGSGPSPRLRQMAMETRTASADASVPIEAGKTLVQVTVSGSIQMK